MATITLSPTDHLAAIIAAGVARYQETLPEWARNDKPVVMLPDFARTLAEVAEPEPKITLDEDYQRELCLSCPLAECVEITSEECPIRKAQHEVWRKKDKLRRKVING